MKHKLLSKINTLNEFINETEIDGLRGVKAYFQNLKGENLNIKVQNNVAGSKKPKEIEVFVTDNITLEELREQIA